MPNDLDALTALLAGAGFVAADERVDPGVYVPRWQSEPLARRAVARLPADGAAIDLCTGTGAMAKTLMTHDPGARVVASDLDERAVACAAANGRLGYVVAVLVDEDGDVRGVEATLGAER